MAKLHFFHGVMSSGKTVDLLKMNHNYVSNGRHTILISPECDDRSGSGRIQSGIGISAASICLSPSDDLFAIVKAEQSPTQTVSAVLVDEVQFFTPEQIEQMSRIVDELGISVSGFGLRVDAFGNLFPGSKALIELADSIEEIKQLCFCGKKATMNMRFDKQGDVVRSGAVIETGGKDKYRSVCRSHWRTITHISEFFSPDIAAA
jgi:thymidine kinase